jgi:hypothetical protein
MEASIRAETFLRGFLRHSIVPEIGVSQGRKRDGNIPRKVRTESVRVRAQELQPSKRRRAFEPAVKSSHFLKATIDTESQIMSTDEAPMMVRNRLTDVRITEIRFRPRRCSLVCCMAPGCQRETDSSSSPTKISSSFISRVTPCKDGGFSRRRALYNTHRPQKQRSLLRKRSLCCEIQLCVFVFVRELSGKEDSPSSNSKLRSINPGIADHTGMSQIKKPTASLTGYQ